jgi:serine/threonine-protein kinase
VQALVSLAMGDRAAGHGAARALDAAARNPGRELDVTFGRAGLLLAEASLLELCPDLPLAAGGAEVLTGLWSALSALGPVGLAPEVPFLGAAHGWAGFLHATLRWCAVTGSALPEGAALRLSQLAALGEPWGRGVRFRRSLSPGSRAPEYWPGWCGGSAGLVHLFVAAHAALGDERFLELAERSAWAAWEQKTPSADLCCGLGGQAYGLLALYQATGSGAWLSRARELAGDAAIGIRERSLVRDSLYRGEPGIAVLAAEMDRPELAAMPLFAPEGGTPGPAR